MPGPVVLRLKRGSMGHNTQIADRVHVNGYGMCQRRDLRSLSRMWKMCLKSMEEVSGAPSPARER